MDFEHQIRIAAFDWLGEQISLYEDEILPRTLLEKGFYFKNHRIVLIGPQGIWKPKLLELPLSITTTADNPYNDSLPTEFLNYKYRGTDPGHRDNVGLRQAMRKNTPLIYFFGVDKGKYLATWPVYIIGDNPNQLEFKVAVDEARFISESAVLDDRANELRRTYLTTNAKLRLHQKTFRERVLKAYQSQCSLCQIRHRELLDAAHIIPDSETTGIPVIQNGLALCKIHHAAFDSNIIGITPDFEIKVRSDILTEIDGPMLKYGIQSLENSKLILPKHQADWPDRERLELRYQKFRSAS